MLIHIESGSCGGGTGEDELDRHAADCYQSKYYVLNEMRPYLLHTSRASQRPVAEGWVRGGSYFWTCSSNDCERTFSRSEDAEKHVNSPAHDPLVYGCTGCEAEFRLLSGLVQHVESQACGARIAPLTPIAKMLHYLHVRLAPDRDVADQEDIGVLTPSR